MSMIMMIMQSCSRETSIAHFPPMLDSRMLQGCDETFFRSTVATQRRSGTETGIVPQRHSGKPDATP